MLSFPVTLARFRPKTRDMGCRPSEQGSAKVYPEYTAVLLAGLQAAIVVTEPLDKAAQSARMVSNADNPAIRPMTAPLPLLIEEI